jgi:cysteinyl-tRNA synthetase
MLRLYDTRTRQVDDIRPASRGLLRMYSCGPTVYRYAHLGNLRAYLLPDLIRRVAERHGLTVVSCQNITDVGHLAEDGQLDPGGEDKIIAQARAEGRTVLERTRSPPTAWRSISARPTSPRARRSPSD